MRNLPMLLFTGLLLIAAGCVKKEPAAAAAPGAPPRHVHKAPNGGTLVELGQHQFNLEFLFDADRGVLQAVVLDAHAEDRVRINQPVLVVTARSGGETRRLEFRPVANPLTGETETDTSQFETAAEWLRSAKAFDGVVKEITVRGIRFADVDFHFPDNDHEHDHATHPWHAH